MERGWGPCGCPPDLVECGPLHPAGGHKGPRPASAPLPPLREVVSPLSKNPTPERPPGGAPDPDTPQGCVDNGEEDAHGEVDSTTQSNGGLFVWSD